MILLKTLGLGVVTSILLLLLLTMGVYIDRTEWLQNILYPIMLVMCIGMITGLILGIY